ncbi:MAG TPA: aldo/keto reductase [Bacilli bacterium]|jgi:predicted oxidoreductase|nr:aldo/keto reductase family oxidoreductase [Acholeplasmataceae bacterium]HOH62344.1 aldo/keto reductase [Bacilli bacterium]HPM15567.1 aldo/keto reductase [Bacilli bacterium]HPY54775.1 aldo/keto reductase [Bacilli bacterium]HQB95197.1 aldo/keto reductase [Bacilli bacterium]
MDKQIALGCMRLAKLDINQAERLVKKAVAEGIILFDHADIYGAGKGEEIFGEILNRNPDLRSKIKIQTKCGICKGYYDLSKTHILNQVERSLKALKTDYIDILLLHRPDALIDYQEVDEAFTELYLSGKVREFGVSNMNPYQIELFRKFVKQPIKYNQLQFSLVHSHMINQGIFVNMSEKEAIDHSSGLIEYCMLHDISLQSWSSLMASWSEGSLIDNPNYEPLNEKLEILAKKYQVTKNAIAISWILRHPANITAIIGTTSVKHLQEITKAKKIRLTREEWYSLYLSSGHQLP